MSHYWTGQEEAFKILQQILADAFLYQVGTPSKIKFTFLTGLWTVISFSKLSKTYVGYFYPARTLFNKTYE